MSSGWWDSNVKSELSQGDIISEVLLGSVFNPPTYLHKGSGKSGGPVWLPDSTWKPDHDGMSHFLGRGRLIHALVISHDCEIDKKTKGSKILVAPISTLNAISDADLRKKILEQKKFAFMPLPDVPVLGDCYADLRSLCPLDRKIIDGCSRLASMSEDGRIRLQSQFVGFLTRRNLGAAIREQ